MNKYVMMGALSLTFLILFGWTSAVVTKANSLPEVTLPITGYDPRDLLSGHYLLYQIEWDKVDCKQFKRGRCPVRDFQEAHRFYVPEDKAQALEDAFVFGSSLDTFAIIFAYKAGKKPIARQLLINGKPWQESVQ